MLRIGCPGLEDLVEDGQVSGPPVTNALREHLKPLLAAHTDVIVLGCTHYPFLSGIIRRLSGATITDSGRAIARRTRSLLSAQNQLRTEGIGRTVFYTNGSPAAFSRVASLLLKRTIRGQQTPR